MSALLKGLCIVSALLCLTSPSRVQAHVYSHFRPVYTQPRFQLVPPARPLRPSSFPRPPMFSGFNPNQPGRGLPAQMLPQQQQPFQPFPPVTVGTLQHDFMPPEPFREAFNPEVNPFEPLFPAPLLTGVTKFTQNDDSDPAKPAVPLPFLRPFSYPNKLPSVPIGGVPSENIEQAASSSTMPTSSAEAITDSNMAVTTTDENPAHEPQVLFTHPDLDLTPSPLPVGINVELAFEHPVIITPPVLVPLGETDEFFSLPPSIDVPMTSTIIVPTLPLMSLPATNISPPMPTNETQVPEGNGQGTVSDADTTIVLPKRSVTEALLPNVTTDDTFSSTFENITLTSTLTANNSSNSSSNDGETIEFPETFDISSMDNVSTDFSCKGRSYGYYADVETDCHVFHHCIPLSDHIIRATFLCPMDTVFNQMHRVCTLPSLSIPCADAPNFYSINDELEMLAGREPASQTSEFLLPHPSLICTGRSAGNYPDPMATTCNSFVRCSEVKVSGQIFLAGEHMTCTEGQVFHGALGQCISVPSNFTCAL